MSEATRHLTPELKARYPQIDWRAIADAGNVYRHVYHDVDLNRVWAVATALVDPLRRGEGSSPGSRDDWLNPFAVSPHLGIGRGSEIEGDSDTATPPSAPPPTGTP
ncbi:MAG: HepT-like ribonuclease domain-containing protein [Alphaproteobacteria bacterium]